jgi:hypothetical protein
MAKERRRIMRGVRRRRAARGSAEDDEDGEDGTWDAALRGDSMRVGTRVFVNEGMAPGMSGRRANPFFEIILSHRAGCRYVLKPIEGRQQVRAAPAYALFNSTSWLANIFPSGHRR